MKYTYAYKTSDGIRHEDSMNAASREEVFAELRKRGIKAIKVVAADGSKANGEVRGVRKRAVAALVALAAVCAGVVAYFGGTRTATVVAANSAISSPRHQIYGDPAIMEPIERGDFGGILPREGDKMLAIFAQPGKLMCAKGVNPRRLNQKLFPSSADNGRAACPQAAERRVGDNAPYQNAAQVFEAYAKKELGADKDIQIAADDSREVRELKQIVNGMREEMREYLANGNGTPRSYWRRLNERTLSEMQIYERTRRELEKETRPEIWEQKNESLRILGLRTIPAPNE
ncbi:MAG: hypothetical protein E7046_08655 [Lentisphaerae bacterium]|nr:hypothetical protein [Lentisphaerota bacterium]